MRNHILSAAALLLVALPAGAFERREIETKDRVFGTITTSQTTHEYLVTVPRDAVFSMSLPKVKGSSLQGSMSVLRDDYRNERLFLIGRRKIQQQFPPAATTTYRALVQGVNGSVGDYVLKPKVKVRKRYKIRGKLSDLAPPGQITFGALAGYQVQVTITWSGPDPVTMGSFTAPDGSDMTSELEPKQKKTSFRQKGFVTPDTGDYRVVLGIPPTAKAWTLEVKQKGKPVGTERQLRDAHMLEPELTLEVTNGPNPLIRINGEVGGGNEFVLGGNHREPALFGAFGSEIEDCGLVQLEAGSTPSSYLLSCDDTHSALIFVGERDENRRILDYVADPVIAPSGAGTVSFPEFTYDSPNSSRLLGWTEIRTFAESGNEHTLVVSDIRRLSGGVFTYTVVHTAPDGATRRYDLLPFNN